MIRLTWLITHFFLWCERAACRVFHFDGLMREISHFHYSQLETSRVQRAESGAAWLRRLTARGVLLIAILSCSISYTHDSIPHLTDLGVSQVPYHWLSLNGARFCPKSVADQ